MSLTLVGCVTFPHLLAQLARRNLRVARGHAVVVTSDTSDRAVVIDACPYARSAEVAVGMSVYEARRRVPGLITTIADREATEAIATLVEHTLLTYANAVERHGAHTWLLPLVALGARWREAEATVLELQTAVHTTVGMVAAIGVGPRPLIARIAAEVAGTQPRQPRVVVRPGDERAFLTPLPVTVIPGLGPTTATTLARHGVTTVGQLAALPDALVLKLLGARGRTLHLQARGFDVELHQHRSHTVRCFWHAPQPCTDTSRLLMEVTLLVERIGRRIRVQGVATGQLTVGITWVDGRTHTHTVTLHPRSDLDRELAPVARTALHDLLHTRRLAVRGIDVSAADLGPRQADLLSSGDSKPYQLQRTLDTIRSRWGTGAIRVGAIRAALQRRRAA